VSAVATATAEAEAATATLTSYAQEDNAPEAAAAKSPTTVTAATTKFPRETIVGPSFTAGGITFINSYKNTMHLWEFADYRLIIDCASDDASCWAELAPAELKPLLEPRWYYAAHLYDNVKSPLTEDTIRGRVMGGQILAYRCTPFSLMQCLRNGLYYGFLPTCPELDQDVTRFTHQTPVVEQTAEWPRRLYISLHRGPPCFCGVPGCWVWENWTPVKTMHYCGQHIPWGDLYIMLGEDLTEKSTADDPTKNQPRNCQVCAQCFQCITSAAPFCRKHVRCIHQRAITTGMKAGDPTTAPTNSRALKRKIYGPDGKIVKRLDGSAGTLLRSKIKDCRRAQY
jgi:hypothetical protein